MVRNLYSRALWLVLVLSTLAFFAGCGSGPSSDDGDGGSTGESVPTVKSTVPADGASGVAVDSRVSVIFSDDISPDSITASTFVLRAGDETVPGTVRCSGGTATFTPSVPLAEGTTYTAVLTTGVKSAQGKSLGSEYSWSFTTGSGEPVYAYVLTGMLTRMVLDDIPRPARSFTYHADANMVEETSEADEYEPAYKCRRYFDAAGDLVRKEEYIDEAPEPLIQLFYYNERHHCTSIVDSNNNSLRQFTYEYAQPSSLVIGTISDVETEYVYYPGEDKLVMDGIEVMHYFYDDAGREIRNELDYDDDSTVDYTTRNTYDTNGNISKTDYYEGDMLVVSVTYTWELKDISGMAVNFAYLMPYATDRGEPTLLWQLVSRINASSWNMY